jgi:cyclic-di-GMP-binding protein
MSRLSAPVGTSPIVVNDLKSCERWLAQAPLADPRQACFELTTLLEDLEANPPAPRAHLEVLDRLRDAVHLAQEESAKKFVARPLPLRDAEVAVFDQVYDLWTVYGQGYRRLALAVRQSSAHPLAKRLPYLIGRAIDCLGMLMYAHYQARREVSSDQWRDLHELYAVAETLGIETKPLEDYGKRAPTCLELYVRALLMHLSSSYSLTSRELEWTWRWTRGWAYKVTMTQPEAGRDMVSVDLDREEPPRTVRDVQGPSHRFLDLTLVKKSVRKRIRGLEEGYSVAELALGSDVNAYEAANLLAILHQQWFESPVQRQFKRRLVSGRAEVAITFPDIHMAIGGRLARAPKRVWDYSRRDTEQLFVYGKADLDFTDGERFVAEPWEQLDDSANGFRLRRKGQGERLAHHQLIGLRPNDAPAFILADVRWLTEGGDRALTMGVRALPGLAQPISARALSGNELIEAKFQPAFVLPSSPGCEPSLVLPLGMFRDERIVELQYEDMVRRVRLVSLVQRGFDFERCTFQITQ